ncbi:Glycosyl transferase family 2 [Nitrosomonas cryotolerans]|uniref:Glycosyl transferase family 2 n=1 Tax=Nitrosomonas cryotolerans ATCC 49181 TaxID=1131553 RepID=A0A1N6GX68_9PROT|nr:rhamnan synthesis F family protein [Nitrosomonas cryotolerans]SFP42178.1 Glycosyl transferase family 2 [Nitrosomonas cryotolerans]SIO12144.1 Glycosyl transferase family 2 [Nitrosomonas cryotolerans ATCC 49181]
MENLLVPYQAVNQIPCTRALIFAPHPDDEVFGCGGAILHHIERGIPVGVIILSDGAYGISDEKVADYTLQRQNESRAAAAVLGYGTPIFWQYRDREIRYSEKLIQKIMTTITEAGADLVYAPSVFEMHPDHRALGMVVVEAVRRFGRTVRLALYEIGIPLHPNLLLDISALAARKLTAMECFKSQNTIQRYDLDIAALNRYRTYTLPATVTAAEAYILVTAENLLHDPFKLYQSEHVRQKALGLTLDNRDTSLVSVIIRSMDRPTLSDALDSVALQTYANIEVVVVNAKGIDHGALNKWCGPFPLRLVSQDEPLNRSQAANIGLQSARGDYLIFLDDDDLFYPEHITALVTALQNHPDTHCAYAGVRVEHYIDGQLETLAEFNEPFDLHRLWGRNFIPMHAMLFAHSLVTEHCCFDETLALFEDWDFWLQLSQHSKIMHVNKISAVYRNHGHSGLGLKQDSDLLRKSRGQIYDKWKAILTGAQLDDLIEYRETLIANLRNQSTELHDRLTESHNQLMETRSQLATLHEQLRQDDNRITTLQEQRNQLLHDISASRTREKSLRATIDDLVHSTSWRISAPLRFLARIVRGQHREAFTGVQRRFKPFLKALYWYLPARWRNRLLTCAYRTAGPLFTGMPHYESWRTGAHNSAAQFLATPEGQLTGMIDLANVMPLAQAPAGNIAIHAHIFYADLATELAKLLHHMPFPYDLFVSVPDEKTDNLCRKTFSGLPRLRALRVTIVANRGRDIAPFFSTLGEALQQYDYIAHIHSKKSLYNQGATNGWREYLLSNLFGSETQIRKIFTLLTHEDKIGLVYPQNFSGLPYSASTWLSNRALGRAWCQRLGITPIPAGYFDYPAGSMFWARSEALQPLFKAGIKIEDFPEEAGQTDATLAHCLERLLVLVSRHAGYNSLILRDVQSDSWSRWRFEQYLARRQDHIQTMLADPTLRVVVFDIFDTLLIRPLLNPEDIKSIIARHADETSGKLYLKWRATAEAHARQKAGRDIGLDAIFKELSILSELPAETIAQLRHLEETIELEAVMPRPEVIALFNLALQLDKQVILASDMYLPRSTIETMLNNHAITGWRTFYLSSDTGLRKDTGDLYQHILTQEQVAPDEILVIGDNEHSDVQIPYDIGMRIWHVLRPVELARAIPRLSPLIERALHQDHLNTQLTLGMIVQANFQPLFFPRFDPADLVPATPWAIGYTVAGPLVLSFVQWLAAKASADGMQCLYFLAREGQILKLVYDRWVANDTQAIASDYLVLSRRTVTVPMISNLDDILEIARVRYFPNSLSEFIHERYGVTLSHAECAELAQQKLWPEHKLVTVEDQDIHHLVPVLGALEARILAQAQAERPGLLAYLQQLGLNTISAPAIVDIGYAATIQGRLNRLMNKAIHGYYLVTEERAQTIATQYNVIAQGCFGHYVNAFEQPPTILKQSFSLEKLLSADDAQIICYRLENTDKIIPEFRHLSDAEHQAMATRAEIRRGIMDFVDQSIAVRDKLLHDFEVPPDVANTLFEAFIEHPSQSEQNILGALTLDDYYCGRGLVS